jgi:dTDP-4-amino-4,6-dideoxygalactose transaminase
MSNEAAILGGAPVFDAKIGLVRPVLPDLTELGPGVESIITSGMVTKGRYLREFEEAVAAHLGVKHAVAVSSCTTGLMLTYQGLGLKGDVVVPSFTFMATVSALVWAGARPVFAEVDAGTTNLSPEAAEAAITPNTTAIVAVHNFGNPAEVEALEEIARRRGLKLVFDAAHGFGALCQGKPVGGQGDANVFSLSPTKLLIAGEGGIVATNNDALAEWVRLGREYGNSGNYDSAFAGINARMPEFNALLGLGSLKLLEAAARRRDRCSYKDFSITVDGAAFGLTRDELALALGAEGVDTRKYYDPPAHRQTAYRQFAPAGRELPHTDWLAASSLSLPLWSKMDDEVVKNVCRAVTRAHRAAGEISRVLRQGNAASAA